jgi:cytochrome c oxidase cbb3-type subunit 2
MRRFLQTIAIPVGALLTVLASWLGLVRIPDWQLRDVAPVELDDGSVWPLERVGDVRKGRDVYIDLGCIYCHSQQVRPLGYGADIERGWGARQTLPIDYLYDEPPLLGTMRTGPDLTNIGGRQPDRTWHLIHLYRPTLTSPGSIMPAHPFLFSRIPKTGPVAPPDSLSFSGSDQLAFWLVPTRRADDLVDYLLSLKTPSELPTP